MKTSSSFKAIHFGIHTTISRIEDLRVAKRNIIDSNNTFNVLLINSLHVCLFVIIKHTTWI